MQWLWHFSWNPHTYENEKIFDRFLKCKSQLPKCIKIEIDELYKHGCTGHHQICHLSRSWAGYLEWQGGRAANPRLTADSSTRPIINICSALNKGAVSAQSQVSAVAGLSPVCSGAEEGDPHFQIWAPAGGGGAEQLGSGHRPVNTSHLN